jgi:hypothetical protein
VTLLFLLLDEISPNFWHLAAFGMPLLPMIHRPMRFFLIGIGTMDLK